MEKIIFSTIEKEVALTTINTCLILMRMQLSLIPPNISCGGPVQYFVDDICVSTDSLTCVDISDEIIDFTTDSTTIQSGSCINLNLTTVVDYAFYMWLFPGGDPSSSTDSMPVVCYDSVGTYPITLIAYDSGACRDTIFKSSYITVEQGAEISNVGGFKNNVQVYPNPVNDQFTLEIDLEEETQLTIKLYHFTGQLIRSEEIDNVTGNYTQQMDLSGYSKGIYYLQIMTEEGIARRKVIYQ